MWIVTRESGCAIVERGVENRFRAAAGPPGSVGTDHRINVSTSRVVAFRSKLHSLPVSRSKNESGPCGSSARSIRDWVFVPYSVLPSSRRSRNTLSGLAWRKYRPG